MGPPLGADPAAVRSRAGSSSSARRSARSTPGSACSRPPDEAARAQIMDEDPAIAEGFATGELRPMQRLAAPRPRRGPCGSASALTGAGRQGTCGTSGRRANASTKRPIIFGRGREVVDPDVLVRRVGPAVRAAGAERRRRDAVLRRTPGTSARCPASTTPMLAGSPTTSSRRAAAGWTTGWLGGVHQAGSPSRTMISMSREPLRVEVAPQGGDHSSRVLVRDDPDVEPRVGLGRGDGLGRRLRVARPQALEVEGRRERQRLRGRRTRRARR